MRDKLNDPARIELMREAIANIETFMQGTDTCEAFESNKILCHAVIYNLQCIGEGVYRLSTDFIATHKDIDWEAVEGLRHVLVHDYYTVNMKTIWNIIQKDLPAFKRHLQSLAFGKSPANP